MSNPRARILYIDDDPGLCRLVQKDFERRGYAVDIATGGTSGLARLVQGGIDVVALDHYMPERDGLETLADIRALAAPPPVIYVTAMQEIGIAVAALKAGAVDYVVKDARGEFLPLLDRAIRAVLESAALRRDKEAAESESMRTWHLAECIVNTIRDPMVVLEHDMTIVTANTAFLTIFGITAAEMYGRPLSELGQHQWDVPTLRHLMEQVLPKNKPIESFEIEDDFPGLGRRVFNLNARKIIRPGNHVHRMLLVFEDITDRKQRERDAQMLTNEVSHRIKNNLQIVVGLLSFEAHKMPEPYGQGYKAMQARIGAIARLYDLISQSRHQGVIAADVYLEEIAKSMSASLLGESSGIKIEVKTEALGIAPDLAVPFGLLVNELGTNAIKHAFPNGVGHVVLGVEEVAGEIQLTVADNGVGMKARDSTKTSGKRGADYVAIFVRQLGGAYTASASAGNGTTIRVRVPSLLAALPGQSPSERAAA
jgi:PAS domain S-box-containing protein